MILIIYTLCYLLYFIMYMIYRITENSRFILYNHSFMQFLYIYTNNGRKYIMFFTILKLFKYIIIISV